MKRPDKAIDDLAPRAMTPGRGEILRPGRDGVIVACGLMVAAALQASDRLALRGIEAGVVNMPTIKPLDETLVVEAARGTRLIVAAENHSIVGGLGSAIAETLLEAGVAAGFARVGVQDRFAEGGSTPYLQAKFGLNAEAIIEAYGRAAQRRDAIRADVSAI